MNKQKVKDMIEKIESESKEIRSKELTPESKKRLNDLSFCHNWWVGRYTRK